jgi:hypothetical protein
MIASVLRAIDHPPFAKKTACGSYLHVNVSRYSFGAKVPRGARMATIPARARPHRSHRNRTNPPKSGMFDG